MLGHIAVVNTASLGDFQQQQAQIKPQYLL